ncbi:Protein CBG22250 [Caenorhabditis briggsae]|uniref:Transmembrane protein 26 n=2 Tax=Caenorhabditis briggsae TaxID=6238 RepID=A0AAE9E0B1_CAEBR|nr:Protein CBG22250 [Caenorhabditis briggsae]ULU09831.1 hypothetical protein L3Y34_014304 [Caenorhabditis briggsae]UMM10772.1 hypothetical protein L5515_000394 [Caenorhabditis briggsae]CAP38884.2 Protein CBG22250 [Caenorhabditis briggsae]
MDSIVSITKNNRHQAKVKRPNSVDASHVLISCLRAILARGIFIVHSIVTIRQTVLISERESVWGFALLSLLIVFEGGYAIIMRAGDERKWFCTSVLLYIVATAPPIWILETRICNWRAGLEKSVQGFETIQHPVALKDNSELRLQLLEQLLLVNLIVGRWLLPKGDISREQLSQILLAYLAISSDIVEFFDVFKEKVVYSNSKVQTIVLSAWTLSLLQFPFVLTVSRARKMRVAITNDYEQLFARQRPRSCFKAFYDVDIWAIFLANALQDVPFLLTRLYLMTVHNLVTYTMIFFFFKNMLIILLQTYRSIIIINDRYINPKPPDMDIIEHNMDLMKSRNQDIDDDFPSSPYHKSHHHKGHEKQSKKEKKREKKRDKKSGGHKNGNRHNNGNETPKKTRRSSSTTPTRTPKQRRTSSRSISEEREQLFPRHHGRRMDRLDTLEET